MICIMDMYVLSLHGEDVVLGLLWLVILGPVVTDYAARIRGFSMSIYPFHWVGDSRTELQRVQFHSL